MTAKLPTVNLVDVNNLLHIGNHRFRNYSIKDVNGFEIRTGGMYMLLNLLRGKAYHPTGNTWIFCFDRHSYRREIGAQLGIDYKSGRQKMPAHLLVQADELYKWLPKIGYNALAMDGFEADDIISTIANQLKDAPVKVNIFSTDRDNAYHVSEKCTVVSSNSRVPSVTIDNYESVVDGKNGRKVYYNSIFLFKVICGDASDKIPPIAKEAYALYLAVIRKLQGAKYPLENLRDFEVLETALQLLPSDLRSKAMDNWELVKPTYLDDLALQKQEINNENLYEFCSIFGMASIAKKFGIALTDTPESVMKYRLDLVDRISTLEGRQPTIGDEVEDEEEIPKLEPGLVRMAEMKRIREVVQEVPESLIVKPETDNEENSQSVISSSIHSVD